MKQLTNEELCYLAGFFDGEGSIIAQIKLNKKGGYMFEHQIVVTLQITQHKRFLWFLNELAAMIGDGKAKPRDSSTPRTGTKKVAKGPQNETLRQKSSVADYILGKRNSIRALLIQLLPFLRLKSKQAKLAIKLIEKLEEYNNDKQKSKQEAADKFIALCVLADRISALNHGKTKTCSTGSVVKTIESMSLAIPSLEKISKSINVPVETSDVFGPFDSNLNVEQSPTGAGSRALDDAEEASVDEDSEDYSTK
jgi:hypothetical protein